MRGERRRLPVRRPQGTCAWWPRPVPNSTRPWAASRADEGRPARRFKDFSYRPRKKALRAAPAASSARPRSPPGRERTAARPAGHLAQAPGLGRPSRSTPPRARGDARRTASGCRRLIRRPPPAPPQEPISCACGARLHAPVLTGALPPPPPGRHPVREGRLQHPTAEALQDRRPRPTSVRRIKIAMASAHPWQREGPPPTPGSPPTPPERPPNPPFNSPETPPTADRPLPRAKPRDIHNNPPQRRGPLHPPLARREISRLNPHPSGIGSLPQCLVMAPLSRTSRPDGVEEFPYQSRIGRRLTWPGQDLVWPKMKMSRPQLKTGALQ